MQGDASSQTTSKGDSPDIDYENPSNYSNTDHQQNFEDFPKVSITPPNRKSLLHYGHKLVVFIKCSKVASCLYLIAFEREVMHWAQVESVLNPPFPAVVSYTKRRALFEAILLIPYVQQLVPCLLSIHLPKGVWASALIPYQHLLGTIRLLANLRKGN